MIQIQTFQHWELIKMDLEFEWYDNVRAGLIPLCDRDLTHNINRDDFFENRNARGVYCPPCWNWIHLKKGTCSKCGSKMTHRSEKSNNTIICVCGNEIQMEVSN